MEPSQTLVLSGFGGELSSRGLIRKYKATKANPCRVCGRPKLCLNLPDKTLCTTTQSPSRTDKFGIVAGWWHALDGHQATQEPIAQDKPSESRAEVPKAIPADLDEIYRYALSFLEGLNRSHRAHLTSSKRGLSMDQVGARGYTSWCEVHTRYIPSGQTVRNSRRILAERLFQEFGSRFSEVPGFGIRHQTGREPIPWTSGHSGIYLPAKDTLGRIVGAQIKADKGPKYSSLSAGPTVTGASSGLLLHCSRPTGYGTPLQAARRVWLTEGILKADIASDLLGEVVVASSGQTFDEATLEVYLRALDPEEVIVALDEDTDKETGSRRAAGRRNTERAKLKVAHLVHNMGFRVRVASWNPRDGKGLDDFLLAGHHVSEMKLRVPKVRKRRGAHLVDQLEIPLPELEDEREEQDLETQRAELKAHLDNIFRDWRNNRDKVFLLRHLPGVGKSTTIQTAAEEATARDKELRVARFIPNHEVGHQSGGRLWRQLYGRTAQSPRGVPCRYADKYSELSRAGFTSGKICGSCPAKALCDKGGAKGEPFYRSQFRFRQRSLLPGNHYFSPNLVQKLGTSVLVLDDLDLDSLSLSVMTVTENDLAANLAAANAEPDPETEGFGAETHLRPAIPLFSLLRDFRAFLIKEKSEGEDLPEGTDLAWSLWRWCQREGHNLEAALESAKRAHQPDPLDGETIETAIIGPKAIAETLVDVLCEDFRNLDSEAESWNTRFSVGYVKGKALAFKFHRRTDLPQYENRPIVIANANVTREQAERWFPNRKVEVLDPRARFPDSARVWQNIDRRYGKTKLQADKPTRERAFSEVRDVLRQHPTGKIGVITHKFFEDLLRLEFRDESRLEFLHFHATRSLNTMSDVRAMIVLGTPHPNEADLIRQTQALYHDQEPISDECLPSAELVEDISGEYYRVYHRRFLDPRLQEQFLAKTRDEMDQALYRCRPLNLDSPQQGDLLTGYTADRSEVDIYVFSTLPLGIPVRVISRAKPTRPKEAALVLKAAAELVRENDKLPTQKELWNAISSDKNPVTYRQTRRAIKWIERERGENWLRTLREEYNPPRAQTERVENGENWSLRNALPPEFSLGNNMNFELNEHEVKMFTEPLSESLNPIEFEIKPLPELVIEPPQKLRDEHFR